MGHRAYRDIPQRLAVDPGMHQDGSGNTPEMPGFAGGSPLALAPDMTQLKMDRVRRHRSSLSRRTALSDKGLRLLASTGLAVGGVFGMAGTFAPTTFLRGLAWGIDGVGLVMASALLTLAFYRKGQDLVASGFLVFVVGEGLILSGAAMDLAASIPSFGAGISLWALALVLISTPRVFPAPVRLLGFFAAVLFGVAALQIFAGIQVTPITAPLPFYAYPVLVATFVGWIWTLLKVDALPNSEG